VDRGWKEHGGLHRGRGDTELSKTLPTMTIEGPKTRVR